MGWPARCRRPPVRLRNLAPRIATGAFVLHSGWQKRGADEETAQGLHGMATGTFPFLRELSPGTFIRVLSATEMAVGTALLLPVIPNRLAGAALSAFSGGLLAVYAATPGMREPGSVWPTPDGMAMAKDVWMLGVGLGLLADRGRPEFRPAPW